MSSKLNVFRIVREHFDSLKDYSSHSPKLSARDLISFFGLPLLLSLLGAILSFNLTDALASMLVNFGSILSALLLSVLVLVYDQEYKLTYRYESLNPDDKQARQGQFKLWRELLQEAYANICYAIIVSISLVIICFIHGAAGDLDREISIPHFGVVNGSLGAHVLTPMAIALASNLLLTVLMIVKRFHGLLTSEKP